MGKKKTKSGYEHVKSRIVDGIKFKSELEIDCYKELKRTGMPFEYEPYSFELVDESSYPGICIEPYGKGKNKRYIPRPKIRNIKYTPDFIVEEAMAIIETKGRRTPDFDLRWKLFKNHLIKQNKIYDLYMPWNKFQIRENVMDIWNKWKDLQSFV